MSISICGLSSREFPDLGEATMGCCYGTAMRGREAYTCWRPVYDLEQQPLQVGKPEPRPSMCGDCALRPNSPERGGDESYANAGDDDLEELVASGQRFYCHDGMRRRVRWSIPRGR